MATINLGRGTEEVNDGLDAIVNIAVNADLPGGAFLQAKEWQEPVIKAGHVIIRNKATKECAPLDAAAGAYKALPEGWEYFGTLRKSVLTNNPQAAVVLAGVINEEAIPYPVTTAIKSALVTIKFI